jgi:hypothetical protein
VAIFVAAPTIASASEAGSAFGIVPGSTSNEEEEEGAREHGSERHEERARPVRGGAREHDAGQEGPDGGGDVERFRRSGGEQQHGEDAEQERLVRVAEHRAADRRSVASGHGQDRHDHERGQDDGDDDASGAPTDEQHGRERQEPRHHQILDYQDGQDQRGLAVAHPPQVVEGPSDHTGRRDVGHASQEDRGHDPPAEQQPGDQPRREVQQQIDGTDQGRRSNGIHELAGGVFESQREEQQDQSDLGARRDESIRGDQRDEPALTERQARDEVQGDGREPEALGDPGQDREEQDHPAELEQERRAMHRSTRAKHDR